MRADTRGSVHAAAHTTMTKSHLVDGLRVGALLTQPLSERCVDDDAADVTRRRRHAAAAVPAVTAAAGGGDHRRRGFWRRRSCRRGRRTRVTVAHRR